MIEYLCYWRSNPHYRYLTPFTGILIGFEWMVKSGFHLFIHNPRFIISKGSNAIILSSQFMFKPLFWSICNYPDIPPSFGRGLLICCCSIDFTWNFPSLFIQFFVAHEEFMRRRLSDSSHYLRWSFLLSFLGFGQLAIISLCFLLFSIIFICRLASNNFGVGSCRAFLLFNKAIFISFF